MQRNKDEADNLEEAEVRLKRHMQMQEEAMRSLNFSQWQSDNSIRLLQTLKRQHEQVRKSFLFSKVNHFQGSSARLSALATAAKENKHTQPVESKVPPKTSACSQSKHLFQIFSRTQKEEEQMHIQQLQHKLGQLYARIATCVQEELLNQKVIARIKKEARRAAKAKAILVLQKQIGKYKGWLEQSKAKLTSDLSQKQVEQKVVHNIESMKLLMNKKILSNDYIYDHFGEEAKQLHQLVENMDSFKIAMQAKAAHYSKAVQECLTQLQLSIRVQPYRNRQAESSSPCSASEVVACFQQGQNLMNELEQCNESLTLRYSALQASISAWQKKHKR